MWLFGRHKHLSSDRLSEYLDGRLSAGELARVDRAVAMCADCREELRSLRETRSLLQSLPPLDMPRSFVFAAAPAAGQTMPPDLGRPAVFRMPGWAYAGAAAVAGVTAVLIVVTTGGELWSPTAEVELADTMAMSAPSAPQASESVEMAAAQFVPAPTAAPAAASAGMAMAQAESAPFQREAEPSSSGAQASTAEGMMAEPASIQEPVASEPAPVLAREQAALADSPTPTPAPAAMMEPQTFGESATVAEPESIEPEPTTVPQAQGAADTTMARTGSNPTPEGLIPTPTPASVAAMPASVEATATPAPVAEPTQVPTDVEEAPATAGPQPTPAPAAAMPETVAAPTPDIKAPAATPPAVSSPGPTETSAATPTATPAQPQAGAATAGRMDSVGTSVPSPKPTLVTPQPEVPVEPSSAPTAVRPAVQPTVGASVEAAGRAGEQTREGVTPETTRAEDIPALATPAQSEAGQGEQGSPASRLAEQPAPVATISTPESSRPALTAALQTEDAGVSGPARDTSAGPAGTRPGQLRETGVTDRGEPQDAGIGLTWVLVGLAVVILLLVLVFGRRLFSRGNSSG